MSHALTEAALQVRKSTYPINPLILGRWSPRAMTGEPINTDELMALFEAARWAPSSYNAQPWRFIYARRDTEHWDRLFNLMVAFNQSWAKNAAVLAVVVSRSTFEHNDQPALTHQFDAGAAWQNLATEAASRGLVAHGMQGFDYDRAKKDLAIPDGYTVLAMIAVGTMAAKETLSAELQKNESPSDRKTLTDIVMEGTFR